MKYSVLKTITIMALTGLIVAPFGHSSAKGQPARSFSDPAQNSAALRSFFVFGDFDGDHRLDQAERHSAGAHQCIRVRLGNSLESHLEFGAHDHSFGALAVWDVNHDDKADLIWVYHSRPESALVWLGDGLGHFAKAAELNADDELRGILFGDSDPAVVGDVDSKCVYLALHEVSPELPRARQLEDDILKALVIGNRDRRRDLGLFLSYLRERGPPPSTASFNNCLA